jgi:transglutaminase-like putative cysteine protease
MVPSGPAGISATLKAMVKLARDGSKDPGVRQLAADLVRGLPQYDIAGELKACHAFVRDHIRYTNDIVGMELLQTPRATLEMGVGDCDDKSTLLAALLQSIGRRCRFVALGFNGASNYSHVLVEARMARGWIPLETIRPVEPGWYPKNVTRRMIAYVK